MQRGSLFLLVGILALWAGLQPASGQVSPDICKLPKEAGPCKMYILRFYYDSATRTCRPFVYGGCKGNENNFVSFLACLATCKIPDICRLPADTGPCKAYITRYYYDVATRTCKPFVYGGCEGNENNFGSSLICQLTCKIIGQLRE
ncbi:kunitz-type serine protease inhibitor vestiginin-7-like [Alligator sinensis]|uniref:Kunitz-type serine protease inhibitor vestiginin-7-like n=1 Tax=Alligator sinensis TaxID=38654 RepID=A0A1U7RWM4_ALLSI|nr:kunitz-type serine protease inhibitor vestiginin-7-like [Alligator sinensis]